MYATSNFSERLKRNSNHAVKRAIDIFGSIVGIVLFSPVFLLVYLAIKIEERGPAIFKQYRTGKDNEIFAIYKFRSMRMDACQQSKATTYHWRNGVPDDFVFKAAGGNEDTVTRVGAFIRKYSLDELPQFFNILVGDMSFVGPRPEIVSITDCYSPSQQKRLKVKPGLTGWAQVNGRSNMTHGQKIAFDIHYVNRWSIAMDIKILLMTVFKVIRGEGSV
ncbi:sugar transferase [Listeria booriae]|uniref:Sugar transferase n=1 Tax=Listeria booriae TaxID=1552123 RepID=A0A7X1CKS6_9LIST|nr:sugar transferase [Listeria booriae]MBC1792419.1 sugar transferase [Listeria booriae]MBC1813114.1 sugar transferase [Listeria booriae]